MMVKFFVSYELVYFYFYPKPAVGETKSMRGGYRSLDIEGLHNFFSIISTIEATGKGF